ncbi:MAG: hypothetical protein DME65_09065 [Verrucomicrobia bacterium]|nr:MAG: hypothetical protein DME65_09065 [Verrucomicrobiota bacterium]
MRQLAGVAVCPGYKKGSRPPASANVNRTPRQRVRRKIALTTEFRCICSLEHGTIDAKPFAETSATSDTAAAAKITQACATTRIQSMAETSLKPLKAILEKIREQADFALKQLQQSEEQRSTRWKCKDCKYTKHFTRPVPLEAAGQCPRCKSSSLQCVA